MKELSQCSHDKQASFLELDRVKKRMELWTQSSMGNFPHLWQRYPEQIKSVVLQSILDWRGAWRGETPSPESGKTAEKPHSYKLGRKKDKKISLRGKIVRKHTKDKRKPFDDVRIFHDLMTELDLKEIPAPIVDGAPLLRLQLG